MARRGRSAIPTAVHLARGSFRRSRHGRRADAPAAVPLNGTLNETQRNLLASIPQGLSEGARPIYERAVSLGYWLQASERDAIVAYSEAVVAQRLAVRELLDCLTNPINAGAAAMYDRIAVRQGGLVMQLAKELGFHERDRPAPRHDEGDA